MKEPKSFSRRATNAVLNEVLEERRRQDEKWGEQNHPSGSPGDVARRYADVSRATCEKAAAEGRVTWTHIFHEEASEALVETDESKLRAELVQVAAVAVAWIECIDRRRRQTAASTWGSAIDGGQPVHFCTPDDPYHPHLRAPVVNGRCTGCGTDCGAP